MPSAIQALRDAFAARARDEAVIVPRTRWPFGDKRLNVMGGGITKQGRYALKSYGAGAYHVLLYSAKGLLAIIEADNLGQFRYRGRRHQFGDAGGDERLAEARNACRRHGCECGQSPRDRSGHRIARV